MGHRRFQKTKVVGHFSRERLPIVMYSLVALSRAVLPRARRVGIRSYHFSLRSLLPKGFGGSSDKKPSSTEPPASGGKPEEGGGSGGAPTGESLQATPIK